MEKPNTHLHSSLHNGRKRLVISLRDPFNLPSEEVELPSPPMAPQSPAPVNLLTLLLPPVIMIIGTVSISLLQGRANWAVIAPMLVMSLGFPVANFISQSMNQKKYRQEMENRKQNYQATIKKEKARLDVMVQKQRQTMEQEYPSKDALVEIALSRGRNRRLWWRRPQDSDFLSLRIGTGNARPSFTVKPPRMVNHNDPLNGYAQDLQGLYQQVANIPLLMSLKTAGSVVIAGKTPSTLYGYARKLLLDLLVNHSPENVAMAVIADGVDAVQRWEWLKWMPHTRSTNTTDTIRHLAFTKDAGNRYLLYLKKEYDSRKERTKGLSDNNVLILPAIVLLLDDTGKFREQPDVAELAAYGYQVGIYLLFLGERGVPNVCRSRLDVTDPNGFRFVDTKSAEKQVDEQSGVMETMDIETAERAARVLAGLEVAGGQMAFSLPDRVRLSQILAPNALELDTIKQTWINNRVQSTQMQFPVGIYIDREGPSVLEFDFRSTDFGGSNEFHALAIGSTSSGKSIFLQSVVLAAVQKYSPSQINFLLIDFKGGASELKKISHLPHVVGMVTDIDEAATERALQAIDTELRRRQILFDKVGSVKDIWDFNEKHPDQAMPQLVVVIDELAKGVEMMPDLDNRLMDLGRRGRAIGLYYLVANQQYDHTIEKLIPNVSWYFVFKVKRGEEMRLIDRGMTERDIPRGNGHGYMRIRNDVFQFQGAFSGLPVQTGALEDVQEFNIARVEPDGQTVTIYKHRPQNRLGTGALKSISEQEQLCSSVIQAAIDLKIPAMRRIYLDPIPQKIDLGKVLEQVVPYRSLEESLWSGVQKPDARLMVPIGMMDIPEQGIQPNLSVNFKDKDGHLWIIGNPGSGKAMTISTLLCSLAATHQPDEVQFFILEYGSGSLRAFESLPHTGAVIRLQEQERLERLISYMDSEIEARTTGAEDKGEKRAEIFIVINNFAELRRTYPDQADAIARYIGSGKSAGVHMIIASNRGNDLSMSISSNIARRIVLQMATRDEYLNVIGKNVPLLTTKSEGRGYWVDGDVCECQIAAAVEGENFLQAINQFAAPMQDWQGDVPARIEVLDDFIPFDEALPLLKKTSQPGANLNIPVGISYDTLKLVKSNLLEEMPYWLALGPRQSGRSNLLMSVALGAVQAYPSAFEVKIFSLRRGPMQAWADRHPDISVLSRPEDIVKECQSIIQRPPSGCAKSCLLLIDDLGGAYDAGKESVSMELNKLAAALGSLCDVYIIAAGMREELQNQSTSPFIRLLRQNRTGIVFSKDMSDLDWLGAQIPLAMRKIALPTGRGFFISKGKFSLVQVPAVDPVLNFEDAVGVMK